MRSGVGQRDLLLAALLSLLILTGCGRSAGEVEDAVAGKPGVIAVDVESRPTGLEGFEGPDAHRVAVRMDEEATAAQVMEVFDALADAVDDGDVELIEVVLCCKGATLATGYEMHLTTAVAADLVAAQLDERVTQYRREVYSAGPLVNVTLVPLPFDDVVAFADRYREDETIELVDVVSGGFLLIRDSANADLALMDARQQFVQRVLGRFSLRGAGVTGRGPLTLFATPVDAPALRRYVAQEADPSLRRVVVRTSPPPW